MTRDQSIIELGVWLQSPAGRYLLEWEQDRLDRAVTDAFGFHALQLGLPEIQGLRANRMPHRWVACGSLVTPEPIELPPPRDALITTQPAPVALYCEFDALPFPQHSVDLVVLPHALELAADPHQLLREVERILVPEGRLVISGLNPASLWALRQRSGHAWRGIGLGRGQPTYLPRAGEFIGYWRLRDWLRLLGFHIESGRFGCYRPPLSSERWLQRFEWMDPVGDRWWPVLGAAYFLVAVKRVRGMRLVGLLKNERRRVKAATAAVANREPVEADI
ncbi:MULTISPECIES: class I SAM-dependent methyltransferase [Rubrivivax]|uniref:Methyltransferase domain-containing protein n=1 Tax=Rubrivivax benzoatilyticus TaxID=316997 RepID=A0ABX0I0A4_9BURK|nr:MULTISPECIES: methyltransferase domain-containing protein [Rubrivivax]MCC9598042.1 methyltransferase domain-containing protein [Rubrivivax sp. JA1055]MCC9645701.1 methyltransferase domain-containing protein [Rubrivivax sp. JA1029]NHK99000.1 methyltransferase domain-containing protein [Rubrivivax benzoatilyticus]NHL25137.1 methyltransferase domain-containing protein [Rubrivivax benzoatilyticus]